MFALRCNKARRTASAKSSARLHFMKENEKLIQYHLGNKPVSEDFIKEVERIKKLGRRLSDDEKAELLRKARTVVYSK